MSPRGHANSPDGQSHPDMSQPSDAAKVKFMTRNVSWDPNVSIVEPTVGRRSHPADSSNKASYGACEPRHSILHSLLSFKSTNVMFDARLAPSKVLTTTTTHTVAEPATASGARHLRLISREFPWTIEVKNRTQTPVTCADVFSALYAGLSIPITSAEWTLADEKKKESMQRANRNRRGGESVKRLRRIDWLGSRVYFKGLSRDDVLGKSRLFPEDDLWPDTWVVNFASRS